MSLRPVRLLKLHNSVDWAFVGFDERIELPFVGGFGRGGKLNAVRVAPAVRDSATMRWSKQYAR